ncbi:MAG: hypothetical protein GY815_16415 [Gammaproteobacteria bacterium]|nr:hypothetical protein [Gammaproteobacteria bacterium]
MRLLVVWLGLSLISFSGFAEFSGNVALEAISFSQAAKFENQFDHNTTLSFQPKWDGEWNDGDDLWGMELFMRADDRDSEREHADVRELLWLHLDGDNEWRVGVNTMFWGVTESLHLVDVINQIDGVEGIDGEDKLGQPMLHLKRYQDWGVLDFLVLPGFRERTFRGEEGRPRLPLVVDTDQAEYESSAGQQHIDYALRFSQTYNDLDLGVSWFSGTSRDPLLLPGSDGDGEAVLIPFYEQMTQIGVDAQLIYLDWIWRLELIHREAESSDRDAFVFGFEYTFFGVFDSVSDIGAIAEFSHDNRPEELRGVYDRDLFLGARFALNDAQSTEILAGFLVDVEKQSRSFRIEASRRVGQSWKATLELQTFAGIDDNDPLIAFEDDDYLLLDMAYYF